MKQLREIVGKPLKVNIEKNPQHREVTSLENDFISAATKDAQEYDPLDYKNDYSSGLKKSKGEAPNVGLVDPLRKLKEALEEALEDASDDEFEEILESIEDLDEEAQDYLLSELSSSKTSPTARQES